jgi:hypothetical protein
MYQKFWLDTDFMCNHNDTHSLPMPTTKDIKILKSFNAKDKVKQIWKLNKMAMDDPLYQSKKI